ncbi:PIG-L family deacetylase [Micromonospora sp. NPDC004704]
MSDPILHVVAHEDDDLLFLSTDLADTIRSGTATITAFLTAGQLSGLGTAEGERARNRQRGIQDAYAVMAGVTPAGNQAEWNHDVISINGRQIERYMLKGARVHLIFVGLRDGELDDLYAGTPHRTVIPDGGAGVPQYTYNRADVVALIAGLVAFYPIGEVRTLDPLPESRYSPPDHGDHVTTARLVTEAVTQVSVTSYRAYSIGSLPMNLPPDQATRKLAAFDAYRVYDPAAATLGWTERMVYRWPRGTTWIGRNADGRLQVFTVRQGQVFTWWQLAGGGWSQPVFLANAGGPLAPTLTVGHNVDGRMELFARRLSDHRIVVLWQTAVNSAWSSAWADLGNHNAALPNANQMGAPTAARHADGRLCLFVKNGGGGVSVKSQPAPGDGWGAWVDLGGTDVQDGISAVLNPTGCLEVFAATRAKVLHWYQSVPNGPLIRNEVLPSMVPASAPSAVVGADGRVRVVYRRGGGTDVAVSVQASPGGGWLPPVAAPGPGGVGQLATVVHGNQLYAFARDAASGVSVAQLGADSVPGAWTSLGGTVETPAVVVTGTGPQVFAARAGALAYRSWPAESGWSSLS